MFICNLVLMSSLLTLPKVYSRPCEDNHFYNLETLQCTRCTTCRKYEVILNECSVYNNSVCVSLQNSSLLDMKDLLKYLTEKEFYFDKQPQTESVAKTKEKSVHVPGNKVNVADWKMLCYALTGILGFLIVVSTLIVLFLWRRRISLKKYNNLQNRQGGDAEIGNEYVVFQRRVPQNSYEEEDIGVLLPRLPLRGCRVIDINVRKYARYYRKRLYKPQRRLLPEGVDDVFESEDSAGSRTVRLHTIPEKSDSDIDDSLNVDKKSSTDHMQSSEKLDSNDSHCKKSSKDSSQSSEKLDKSKSQCTNLNKDISQSSGKLDKNDAQSENLTKGNSQCDEKLDSSDVQSKKSIRNTSESSEKSDKSDSQIISSSSSMASTDDGQNST